MSIEKKVLVIKENLLISFICQTTFHYTGKYGEIINLFLILIQCFILFCLLSFFDKYYD